MIQGKEMKSIFRSWSGPRSDMNHFQWIEWIDPRPGRYKEFQFRPSDPSPKKRNNPLTGKVSLRWIISGRKYVSAVTGRPAALIMNKVRVCVFGGRKWRICMMMNNKDIHSRTLTQLDRDGKGKKMHYTQKRGIAAMNQIELGHVSGCRKKQNKRKTYKYGRVQFIAILVNIVLLLLLSPIILLFRLFNHVWPLDFYHGPNLNLFRVEPKCQ